MPNEVPRCTDCGSPLKAVPTWLATAKVSFTCGSCPRRSSRMTAMRMDRPLETKTLLANDDIEVEPDVIEEIDEDGDLELAADDLEDDK
jgi:hypothetical protein